MSTNAETSLHDEDATFGVIDDANIKAIDRWIAGQIPPQPSRREIVNLAIKDWAEREGLTHAGSKNPSPLADVVKD